MKYYLAIEHGFGGLSMCSKGLLWRAAQPTSFRSEKEARDAIVRTDKGSNRYWRQHAQVYVVELSQ